MKKSQIKELVIEAIESTRNEKGHTEFGGYTHGTIKKVIIEIDENGKYSASGKIGFFYKNCKTFETYKGADTRPCEIMTFDISLMNWDEEYEKEVWVDLHDDFNGKGDEWTDKKTERMSDRDFFDFWT